MNGKELTMQIPICEHDIHDALRGRRVFSLVSVTAKNDGRNCDRGHITRGRCLYHGVDMLFPRGNPDSHDFVRDRLLKRIRKMYTLQASFDSKLAQKKVVKVAVTLSQISPIYSNPLEK
jgi:hypothetical protein